VFKLNKIGIRNIEIAKTCKVTDVAVFQWREKGIIPERFISRLLKHLRYRRRDITNLLRGVDYE